jgi:hypothetical protein
MEGLKQGRTFITTGPMLQVSVNELPLGTPFQQRDRSKMYEIEARADSQGRPLRLEILQEGQLLPSQLVSESRKTGPAHITRTASVAISQSTWLVARCFEIMPDGRERFAHSAPIFIDVPGKPIQPRKAEVEYLIGRVEREIERNVSVLSEGALAEYRTALDFYQKKAQRAK